MRLRIKQSLLFEVSEEAFDRVVGRLIKYCVYSDIFTSCVLRHLKYEHLLFIVTLLMDLIFVVLK